MSRCAVCKIQYNNKGPVDSDGLCPEHNLATLAKAGLLTQNEEAKWLGMYNTRQRNMYLKEVEKAESKARKFDWKRK